MTLSWTIRAANAGTADPIDVNFRLFFPGSIPAPVTSLVQNQTDAQYHYVYSGKSYYLSLNGTNFALVGDGDHPSDLSGTVSSGSLFASNNGDSKLLATMDFGGNQEDMDVGELTPDGILNRYGTGQAVLSEFGAYGKDKLWGSDYGDYLFGSDGHDTLTGNGGNDQFVLDRSVYSTYDTITDFAHGQDTLMLDRSDDTTQFKGVSNANLAKTFHDITNSAEQADDRLIYNRDTGKLSYDADGAGGKAAVTVAVFANHAALTFHDVKVF